MSAKHVIDGALDGVIALGGVFDHHVAGVVHHIEVVAVAAGHGVGAAQAVEHVGARISGEAVVAGVAGALEVGGSGEDEFLEMGAERQGQRALDAVEPLVGLFDDSVAVIVDDVGIVAEAADQKVLAGAAVEHVGALFAHDLVAARAAGHRIGAIEAHDHVRQTVTGQRIAAGQDFGEEPPGVVGQGEGLERGP